MAQSPENIAVTVVVPFYNQHRFLGECLESLAVQAFRGWKAIIVDDASPDGPRAEKIVRDFNEPRFHYYRHPENKGLAAARNTGFALADTRWVLPLDSDDMLAPEFLAAVARAAAENPECSVVYTDFMQFGGKTGLLEFPERDLAAMLEEQWIPGPGAFMRKQVWKDAGGYCEAGELRHGNEDWDFWIAALEKGAKPVRLRQPLYYYRRHADSMSRKRLSFNDGLTRDFIYARHRQVFDSHRKGRSFRAAGRWNAALAHKYAGEFSKSAKLGAEALAMNGDFGKFFRLIFRY